jgi:hypothetical protein
VVVVATLVAGADNRTKRSYAMATVADHVIPALQNSGGTPSINVSRRLLD